MNAYTFRVWDSTYNGFKVVVVEATNRAVAQMILHAEGYEHVKGVRQS